MSIDFDAERYLASNPDVLNAIGDDLEGARRHYEEHGVYEGRRQDFDAEDYLAANPDLITAFHNDTTEALHHYLEYGYREGRETAFNAREYLAANRDVLAATGGDEDAATRHYVEHGYEEGRSVYFDTSRYLEANDDLRTAFGDNHDDALEHYLEHGYQEGRETELHIGEDGQDDDRWSSVITTTANSQATITGSNATDRYVATGSVRFQGGDGGDELNLLERGGTDEVVFAGPDDGAPAGSKHGEDEIKHFQTGIDKIIVSGSLLSLADHNGDGALTGVSRGVNGISGGDELVFFSTEVDDLDGDGMRRIARYLGTTQGSGDVLVVASHEDESALYLVHANGGALTGSDIRMLGVFDNTRLSFGDVVAG